MCSWRMPASRYHTDTPHSPYKTLLSSFLLVLRAHLHPKIHRLSSGYGHPSIHR